MRFMVRIRATPTSEAGGLPDEKILAAMGQCADELAKAGVQVAAEGLHSGPVLTPELRQQEERLRAEIETES